MKVLYDHRGFVEKYGGVSKYFSEIIKYYPEEYDIAMKYSVNEYLKEIKPDLIPFFPNKEFRGKYRLIAELNKINSIKTLLTRKYDIMHLTHYDPYLFKYKKEEIFVSTIHDLNLFTVPSFHDKNRLIELRRNQTICANKSDYIITISENSKKDIIKYLGVPDCKITVIHHGVSDKYKKVFDTPLCSYPYILFVGYRGEEYKNFSNTVIAFSIISKKYPELKLVCTRNNFTESEIQLFEKYGVQNKCIYYSATETELINLYSNAIFFVFPSFYEGFGLPLLEAMACECPVVCSDASCFPEIADKAAIYFKPDNIDSIANAMDLFLTDSDLRKGKIKLGKDRVKLFSWEESAKKHHDVYLKLSENK